MPVRRPAPWEAPPSPPGQPREVNAYAFSPGNNSLQNFDGTFVQHCEGKPPALTGELKYDSAPVITPPP
jgi:hypothetical protein